MGIQYLRYDWAQGSTWEVTAGGLVVHTAELLTRLSKHTVTEDMWTITHRHTVRE